MKLLILTIAVILFWVFSPIFILYAIIRLAFKPKLLGNYFFMTAFGIDQLGCVMGAPLMNDVLLKKDATKKYGNPDETISHVTGCAYVEMKLRSTGYFVAHCLDTAEKNHVEKAAETEQRN